MQGKMTYFFSSMESPHWLIAAGTVLLILGFVGLALFSRSDAAANEMASGEEQGHSEPEADLAHTQASDRKVKLEEQKRDRWEKAREIPLNDRPRVSDKETQ
jgi:hypothetical protein